MSAGEILIKVHGSPGVRARIGQVPSLHLGFGEILVKDDGSPGVIQKKQEIKEKQKEKEEEKKKKDIEDDDTEKQKREGYGEEDDTVAQHRSQHANPSATHKRKGKEGKRMERQEQERDPEAKPPSLESKIAKKSTNIMQDLKKSR